MQALKWALAALLALGLAGAAWAEDATKGTVTGILVAKDKASISVKAEGEKEAVKYAVAGDDLAAAIKKIAITNLVTVVWTLTDKQKCVASIEAIIDPAKEGTVTGLLVAKGANFIDVKPLDKDGKPDAKASTERYMPKWHDGAMDKDVTAAIAAAKVGATVQVTWTRDERKRVTALTVTAEPKDEGKK